MALKRPSSDPTSSWTDSPNSSCSSLIQLGASWSNHSRQSDDWIEIASERDADADVRTPNARGSGWTCYVCLQDFRGDEPPIDTQIRTSLRECRSCYMFQTCWRCHLQCECQHARHLGMPLRACRLCTGTNSMVRIDLAASVPTHSDSLGKSYTLDDTHNFPRHPRSQSPSECSTSIGYRDEFSSSFGRHDVEDRSYIFPSHPTQRRSSAPAHMGTHTHEERGRTQTRTPRAKRSGKSPYRCTSPQPSPTSARASSVPPSLSFSRYTELSSFCDDGGCDTPFASNPSTSVLSSLFSTRQTPLPKLGGTHPCAGCGLGVTYFESVMGPLARRFHPVCLRCTECWKDMESGSSFELTKEGLMRFCCKDCLMERSEVVVVEGEKQKA